MSAIEEMRTESMINTEHREPSMAQKGRQALHNGRHKAAEAMHRTASKLDDVTRRVHVPGGEKVAHRLHKAATYVGTHGATEIKDGAGRLFRQHPAGMLAAAAIAGFFIGRMVLAGRRGW